MVETNGEVRRTGLNVIHVGPSGLARLVELLLERDTVEAADNRHCFESPSMALSA
jgi:hypothetical protein